MHDVSPFVHAVGLAKMPALVATPVLQDRPEAGVGAGPLPPPIELQLSVLHVVHCVVGCAVIRV
jgi:hypothetical protein